MAAPFLYVPSLPTEPYRGGAPILPHAPPPPMFMPVPVIDTPLPVKILQQIEYYFSETNLVKDDYLKSNMDEEGWLPLSLIAGFRRVHSLTSDIQMILSSLRDSTVVEVQGETIRNRNDWQKWAKPSNNHSTASTSQQPQQPPTDGGSASVLETSLQNLTLADTTPGETSTVGSPEMLPNGDDQPESNQDL